MCTPTDIAQKARWKLRDFGHFFEVPYTASPVYTIRLPHPNVDKTLFSLWQPDGTIIGPDAGVWELDQRNGIVKIKDATLIPDGVGGSGYYYEWFLDDDLVYAATVMTNQHLYDRPEMADDGSEFSPVECDVIATGTVMMSLWSLMAELSVDIDVSTPEGMSIPAHQRYEQVLGVTQFWQGQYAHEAAMLGVGLDRLEQFTLRRVARLTNRLVPLIREREVDDPMPPERIMPPIPSGVQEGTDTKVLFMPEPPGSIGYGGWFYVGTSGNSPAGSP